MKRRLCQFGKEVKKALIDKGMTQETLAQTVGTTPAYLGLILFGKRSGTKYRAQIAAVLDIKDKCSTDSAAS